jgi:hypothetical protein
MGIGVPDFVLKCNCVFALFFQLCDFALDYSLVNTILLSEPSKQGQIRKYQGQNNNGCE